MPPNAPYLLPYADINWQSDDTPFAPEYDDVYWSSSGGLEEKDHVFIQACDVKQRWQALQQYDAFDIVELGFGFGLNFLLTLRAWLNHSGQGRLEYVSFEKHLVKIGDIERMAGSFGLTHEFELLKKVYPHPVPGPHRLQINETCFLTLVVGDAEVHSKHMTGGVDAVYLDGFSPAKNESLWQQPIIRRLASMLRPGGRISTYSVAGHLRRTLQSAELLVSKVPGFGKKRHMLLAEAPGEWRPNRLNAKRVAVIGAGLTGLFCAEALEKRGHKVTVFDQSGLRYGAVSDIQQIAIYPQISKTPQPYSNLYLRSFQYFTHHFNFNQCGRLELLAENEMEKAQELTQQLGPLLEQIDAEQCSNLLGFKVHKPGLFLAEAGWLEPQTFAADRTVIRAALKQFKRQSDHWLLSFDTHEAEYDALVLATGADTLAPLVPLGLMPLRGQSLRLEPVAPTPDCVLSDGKTWFPKNDQGTSTVSGTYSRFDSDLSSRDSDSAELLESIKEYVSPSAYTSQVGIRSATRDRMPIIGQLPKWQLLQAHLQRMDDPQKFSEYETDLFVCLGFGSHAGTLGPYCAQLITQMMSGDLQVESMQQLDATRFAKRDGTIKLDD